jgi:hypothetical protein
MKNEDTNKTSETQNAVTVTESPPEPDATTVPIEEAIDEAGASVPQEPQTSDSTDAPDSPETADASDAWVSPVPNMKAGTGAGMVERVMANSINASDSDAINNNLEALASGRMHLHVGT